MKLNVHSANKQKLSSGYINDASAHHNVVIGGKQIIYNATVIYPHMTEPRVSIVNDNKKGGYHLVVELPKYFEGRFIPAFVGIRILTDNTAMIHMVRGSRQQTFIVPITNDPLPTSMDWNKN